MNRLDYLKLNIELDKVAFLGFIFMTLYVGLMTYDSPVSVRIPPLVIGILFLGLGWFIDKRRLQKEFPTLRKRGD